MFMRRAFAEGEQYRLKMPIEMNEATKSTEKAMRSFFARLLKPSGGLEVVCCFAAEGGYMILSLSCPAFENSSPPISRT